MAALSYMQRRASGTYEFRKRLPEALAGKPVPAHMRDAFPDLINPKTHCFKRELVRSLATKELKEAKRRDHHEALKATELFDAAVKALTPRTSTVAVQSGALDFKQLGDDVFAGLLADDDAERMDGDDRRHLQTPEERAQWPDLVKVPPSTQMGMSADHWHVYGEAALEFQNDYREAYARRDPTIVYPETSIELRKRGIHWDRSTPEFQQAALVVLEAHVRAYDAINKRQRGDIIPTPVVTKQPTGELGPKLSEALASWAAGGSAHNAKKPNANTVTEAEQAVRYFKELHGDLRLGEIKAIFTSPVYADQERPAGGGGEAAFWFPLIGLLSGKAP
ncbi:DUF6538 domain-containing protein [Bradyrhizobium sp. SYSU BS000235]|uniref:DUF6538 domain-containing protein n=1 Tax=Bradyrhizobium sp. SYSU BS000235 TaxID=3411332 RepID=UPI003C76F285